MVMTCADHMLFMQALSNCDNHWLYNLVFMLNGKPIMQRFFRMEDVGDDVHHMKNASSLYQPGLLFPHTLCTYASLIPRRVIDRVGLFDERFRDGYEDSDYIYRCKKADVRPAVCLNALVWHFGGVTTSDVVTPELSEKNRRLFGEKWINE
jgi:GT2 family glycosyltransferase